MKTYINVLNIYIDKDIGILKHKSLIMICCELKQKCAELANKNERPVLLKHQQQYYFRSWGLEGHQGRTSLQHPQAQSVMIQPPEEQVRLYQIHIFPLALEQFLPFYSEQKLHVKIINLLAVLCNFDLCKRTRLRYSLVKNVHAATCRSSTLAWKIMYHVK